MKTLRVTLSAVATTGAYADLTGKPTLGTAAATDATDYATAAQGATADGAAQKSANLSDLANATTARTNLGLGTSATTAATAYATAAQGAAADAALAAVSGGVLAGVGVSTIWSGSQAAYDAITTPDPDTLYFVTG